MKLRAVFLTALCVASTNSGADAVQLNNESIFEDYAYTAKRPGVVRWTDKGAGFTALETAPGYEDKVLEKDRNGEDIKVFEEIVEYDPATLDRRVLVTLKQLTPAGSNKALVIDDYRWSDDQSSLLVYTNAQYVWREKTRGDYWLLDLETDQLWQLGDTEAASSQMMFGKLSPDGSKFAYVSGNNIYVQDIGSHKITALTEDASDTIINGLFDWAYEEEFSIADGFRWSPDSKRIAYWQIDTHAARDFFIINNTDTLYPQVTAIPYPKVGQENAGARIGVVSLASAATVWMQLPGVPRDMYLPRMDWADNARQLLVQQLNRKQDTNTLFYADADSGEVTRALVEQDKSFLEVLGEPVWLADSKSFLWQSERDGWVHIYRVSRDGKTTVDLTPGNFDVTRQVSVDEKGGWLYFMASPDDMARRYLYRTRLDDGSQMQRVTPDDLVGYNYYRVSADSRWAVHTHSSYMQPPVHSLVSLPDHKVHHVLEDNAELAAKMAALELGELEFFDIKTSDGLRLDGYMLRPPGYDPKKKYPLVHYVYGEPAGQTVLDVWSGNRNLWHMLMSQQGYIVTSIDNRGTAAPRGRDWRRSIYASPGMLETRDQSEALQQVCKRWPAVDCDRIGVWGHSGGGTLTLNLLFRYPEQFHAGASLAPVPDKRLYDSIYQERYSGLLPDKEENYIQVSAITHAANLQGKLLLIHGTGDDNVHYQGTERLVNELIRLNKQFEFMAYPNRRHGLVEGEGTSLHLHTLKTNFFDTHLAR